MYPSIGADEMNAPKGIDFIKEVMKQKNEAAKKYGLRPESPYDVDPAIADVRKILPFTPAEFLEKQARYWDSMLSLVSGLKAMEEGEVSDANSRAVTEYWHLRGSLLPPAHPQPLTAEETLAWWRGLTKLAIALRTGSWRVRPKTWEEFDDNLRELGRSLQKAAGGLWTYTKWSLAIGGTLMGLWLVTRMVEARSYRQIERE